LKQIAILEIAIEGKKWECTVSVIKCGPSSSVVCYPVMVTVLIECSISSQTNYSVVWLVANPMKHPARAWAIITWLQDISAW